MGKIVYRTISEQVFAKLRIDIVTGLLPPGTELKEESISMQFGVSRGPIREALRELTRYGLISPRGKAGYKVASPLTAEVRELILGIRRGIEIFVLERLLPKMTDTDFHNLELILESQKKAASENDVVAVWESDADFHEYLINKFDNTHVKEIWRSGALSLLMMKYERHASLMGSYDEHMQILNSIKSRDMDALVAALVQNIQ